MGPKTEPWGTKDEDNMKEEEEEDPEVTEKDLLELER